ncbi:hypothetical protein RA180_09650 [Aeromonas salmonicida]|uniref:hypothetical protein n=1 Tax=Aeromonas salmonicida TaxID=645 RepID=UPI0027969783|nr:hypothetical protein [Aeromonas salmonicida]MDQ1884256.1 hypothetical protein [Aeromonas salmonicida]
MNPFNQVVPLMDFSVRGNPVVRPEPNDIFSAAHSSGFFYLFDDGIERAGQVSGGLGMGLQLSRLVRRTELNYQKRHLIDEARADPADPGVDEWHLVAATNQKKPRDRGVKGVNQDTENSA